jgi:hypothetical protein
MILSAIALGMHLMAKWLGCTSHVLFPTPNVRISLSGEAHAVIPAKAGIHWPLPVIPAEAGIQQIDKLAKRTKRFCPAAQDYFFRLDSGLRRNDELEIGLRRNNGVTQLHFGSGLMS